MQTFKIGDRVRVSQDRGGKFQTGQVLGPLIQTGPKEEYFIAFDDGGSNWVLVEHLEKIPDDPAGSSEGR